MQASLFTRYSGVLFRPDDVGDLFFNGVASRVDRQIYTNGGELDMIEKLPSVWPVRPALRSWISPNIPAPSLIPTLTSS